MIARIKKADFQAAEFFPQSRRWVLCQPRQPGLPQFKQPVLGSDLLSEGFGGTAQGLVQAIVAVGEDGGLADFDGGAGARPDRESFNDIEQDRSTGVEPVGDSGAEILYTLRRGIFLYWQCESRVETE